MGLYDKLTGGESTLTKYAGQAPPINPLSTRQSRLHAINTTAGYSLDGAFQKEVSKYYAEYDDGVLNPLPTPSTFDLNGVTPITALRDPNVISMNNSFAKGEYLKNLPK